MIAVANLIRYEQKQIEKIESAYVPHIAKISLIQENNYCTPQVRLGEFVQEGQIIANNIKQNTFIHSSVPGKVIAFQKEAMPNGKKEEAILIQLEGEFTFLGKKREHARAFSVPPSQRIKKLYRAGVLNTSVSDQVLAREIEQVVSGKVDCMALRLYDADPSIVTETFISQIYSEKILEGAFLIADTINAKRLYVLYAQDQYLPPKDILIKKIFRHIDVQFVPVKTQYYPQGSFHDIQTTIDRYVNKELKKSCGKISLAIDASTAYDTYRALVLNMPLIEKIIHISGDSFAQDLILKVKIGTPIRSILEEAGGFVQKPAKIIVNGIIKGRAIANIDGPITKNTKAITVLTAKSTPDQTQSPCIHCGRCHQICPLLLQPDKLFQYYILNAPLSKLSLDASKSCTECGLCNMICPSRLPLYQTISLIKEAL